MPDHDPSSATAAPMQAGQILARGVCRHLRGYGFACVEEFVPARGLRVDVMALGPKGEVWVIECKSNRADFTSDHKWQGYLDWCDRYFFAVDAGFPVEILPDEAGLILADGYGAEIIRHPEEARLPAARRKVLHLNVARTAATRLQSYRDPGVAGMFKDI
ncbi:MmcB family DNA repair protein [Celeribacter sp.]|uniref:MmcB family DNA repair protein n=1 Tax=Celeribacter sp. TaxID=1890673 RepID=UPI003A8CF997